MTSPTHILIGLSATIAFSRLHSELAPEAGELLMMLLGSLLPDIDGEGAITRPGGVFNRFLPWRTARVIDEVTISIARLINLLFGHRGFIHAPIIGLTLIGYGAIAPYPLLFWLGWGYFWHIVGDFLTYGGVPAFSPVSAKKYSFPLCRTGSVRELLIAIALLLYVVTYGFQLLPEGTKAGFRTLFHTHLQES